MQWSEAAITLLNLLKWEDFQVFEVLKLQNPLIIHNDKTKEIKNQKKFISDQDTAKIYVQFYRPK